MKYIVYISTAIRLMSDDDLAALLVVARKNNLKNEVSGVLLYSEGTFIQLLEGPDNAVELIFKNIELDTRHKNMIKLIEKASDERIFPDWSMGFSSVNEDKMKKLEGYISSADEILDRKDQHSAITILKTFIIANNISIAN